MSEAAPTPPTTDSGASTAKDHATTARDLDCRRCHSTLTRSHTHASNNRTQTSYVCASCGYGNAAIIERTDAAISDRHARRLGRDQHRLPQNPSVDVIGAFVDGALPAGTYCVERTGDHEHRLSASSSVDDDLLEGLTQRLDTPSTTVDRNDSELVVRDARFIDPEGDTTWNEQPTENTPRPDGGIDPATSNHDHPLPQTGGSVNGTAYGADDARTARAREETMDVSLVEKGGVYAVRGESGNTYEVDILAGRCTCPDHTPICKHQRRVDLALRASRIPRPDGRLPTHTTAV